MVDVDHLVLAGAGAVGPVAVVRWGTTGQHGPICQLEVLLQLLTSGDGRWGRQYVSRSL